MFAILSIFNSFILVVTLAGSIYWFIPALASIRRIVRPPSPPSYANLAVLIPAMDEEAVIGQTIQSILNADYPREFLEIYVVADHCQDNTAAIAQSLGANTYERTGGSATDKGTALAWLFDRIAETGTQYTASDQELIHPTSYQIEELFAASGLEIAVIRRFASYVEFVIRQGDESLRVDLALDSPFRFSSPVESEIGVLLNDLQDPQVDKLLAYYGRAEPRDAVDLYFILKDISVDRLLELAAQKDPGFDLYWFAIALNRAERFPDEIERWPVKMLQPVSTLDLKTSLLDLGQGIMGKLTATNTKLE